MIDPLEFPRLAGNNRITSPATADYNCIAWAAGDTDRWWQPDVFWPLPDAGTDLESLVRLFHSFGYAECSSSELELGFEKLALYARDGFYTHAARQLPTGKWTSKLGRLQDIEHDSPDDLAGGVYGEVVRFMQRFTPPTQGP